MNCNSLKRILPELVSGELNNSTSREALSHINSCHICVREYESFKKAMDALSEPRLLMDVPDSLNYLHLPQRQKSSQHKRLSFALAVVLVAVLALGFVWHLQPGQKPIAHVEKTQPIEQRIANKNEPPVNERQAEVKRDTKIHHTGEPLKVVHREHEATGESQTLGVVAANPERPTTNRSQNKVQEPDKQIPAQFKQTQPEETDESESTIVVVAAWEEPQVPYNVEIEVKNPDSGMVALHNVSRDENGTEQEQSISVKANADTLDNRRTEL